MITISAYFRVKENTEFNIVQYTDFIACELPIWYRRYLKIWSELIASGLNACMMEASNKWWKRPMMESSMQSMMALELSSIEKLHFTLFQTKL